MQELIVLTKSNDIKEVEEATAKVFSCPKMIMIPVLLLYLLWLQLAEMAAAHDKDTGRVLHQERAVYQEHMTGLGGLERFVALSNSQSLSVHCQTPISMLRHPMP